MKCECLAFLCLLIIVASDPKKKTKIQSAREFHFGIVRSTPQTLGLGVKAKNNVKRKKEFLKKNPNKGKEFEDDNKVACDPPQKCTKARTSPYRSADGYCNNLNHAEFGSANIPYRRYLPPVYHDGISSPRMYDSKDELLPSAREVSRKFHSSIEKEELENSEITHMVMQWGQFLDHDLSITPVQANIVEGETRSLSCCYGVDDKKISYSDMYSTDDFENCFPIPIDEVDVTYAGKRCMHFARSVQVRNEQCQISPVEQLNQITAFIDASNVYGSSTEEMNGLRKFSGGLLKTDKAASDGRGCTNDALPTYSCKGGASKCIKTGDVRAPEQVGLTSMHTLFVREHNRIAKVLKSLNRRWDDERVFQESRRIIGAIMQVITYKEFLPIVLGSTMDTYITNYKDEGLGKPNKIDASIRNVFATAAFRFGHSQIKGRMEAWDMEFKSRVEVADLRDLFGQVEQVQSDSCLADEYLRGLAHDRCPKVDRYLSPEVTDRLFEDAEGNKFDLAALNIQRGRDHGLPGYNAWRKFCGLQEFATFEDMNEHTEEERAILKGLYSSPDEIDLFTAGVSEKHVEGGIVGPTFACIMGKQFQALKQGDRYWYESKAKTGFTTDQIAELQKASLSKVLCRCTGTAKLQPNCMKSNCDCSDTTKMMSCKEMVKSDINLTAWKNK